MVPQTEESPLGELAALRPLRGGDPWSLTQLDQIQYCHVKGGMGGEWRVGRYRTEGGSAVVKTAPPFFNSILVLNGPATSPDQYQYHITEEGRLKKREEEKKRCRQRTLEYVSFILSKCLKYPQKDRNHRPGPWIRSNSRVHICLWPL